ncbi:thiol reductant ABC exporter subunit CydC [Woodsholea maritima]|uniref:thiol reductant ABC exporter subunit CydC n=1 Tax=Woodsholea maritima TaxID=240237 RepID=UPI00036C3983|nr:thiol reductant ABC exporter subunit CydC [Woodsholea maritima]
MKDLWPFLKMAHPDRWWLRLGAALAALTVLSGLGLMALSGWFITAAGVAGLAGAGAAFNFFFASGGVRGFAMGRTALRYGERIATHEATFRILARLRLWVFDIAAPLAPAHISRLRAGDMLSRVMQDVDALDTLYLRLITPVIAASAAALVASILLAVFAPLALPGVIGVFLLCAVILPRLAAHFGRDLGEANVTSAAATRAEAQDLVAGLAELKAYGAAERQLARLTTVSDQWINAQRRMAHLGLINAALLGFASPLAFCAGIALATLGGASAPLAAMAGFIAFGLFETAAPLVLAGEVLGKTQSAAKRLNALAITAPAVEDPQRPASVPAHWDLDIENLSLTYPGTSLRALNGVSLSLKEGERVAIIGESGSGKSSLIKALMGFYAPEGGTMTLGGTPLSALSLTDRRDRFALVDQRAELLSTTVRANLRLAKADASEDELWQALELARAADFVRAMPDGLATWIGEQGRLVSGGQGRRLALARAFLKDAPILLLDEPTEGLDPQTEADFMIALDQWLSTDPRRSCLMITHRKALLTRAQRVLTMKDGRLIE